MYIRQEWIKNTHFHEHDNASVLGEVLSRVQKSLEQKKNPVVIFDLDSTLFHVSTRSFEILKEWIDHHAIDLFPGLSPNEFRYSLEDVWLGRGLSIETGESFKLLKEAKNYWRKRFFSNEHLHHDEPMDGAVDFVGKVYELGAHVVYLTGRDVPLMAFGTIDQLRKHQFPIEVERTRLILKPKRHIDDLEFKIGVVKLAAEWGEVIATFENEPKNLIAMKAALGEKPMHVFIETVSSDHAAPSGKDIYRIQSFVI